MKKLQICANCKLKTKVAVRQPTVPGCPDNVWDAYFCTVTNERIWDKYCYCDNWIDAKAGW